MSIYLNDDKNNCCGCGACVNICPRDAVSMQRDEYGFVYPVIDSTLCTECGLCSRTCEKVNKNESDMPLSAFAASHKNKEVLHGSSSGGVFSALAEHFLSNGGAVCGCVFDDKLNAVHICSEKETDLVKIRKSKYLQSDVGLVYREVKQRLKNGQLVLFAGTPCQVAALYAVVGRRHENLITMDLICHGVPSQLLFDKFIAYLEKKHKTKITNFDFRSKKYGWQRFSMEYTDDKQRRVNIGKAREFYIRSFTQGDTIRPNCYSCKYACPNRIGDITIGDFWGHEKLNLKCDISYGTSVFTINTKNAEKWLSVLEEKLVCEEIDYNIAVKRNHCLHKATPRGKNRDVFMQALKDDKIENIVSKYKKDNRVFILRERLRFLIPTTLYTRINKFIARH